MKSLKCIFSICAQNFRKWQTDYRIWCIAVVLVIMTLIYIGDIEKICNYAGTQMPIWIFPFMYSQFYTKLIFTLPVVLLFCNAPFTDSNQIFVYMRCGKTKWLLAQIIYIIEASAFFYLFLLIISLVMTILRGELSLDWGETLLMISADNNDIRTASGSPFIYISYILISFFTPLQAVGFTFLMSWLGAIILGLVIFFFNIVTENKTIGVLIASLLVIMSCKIENDIADWDALTRFSPISWITLDNIDVGGLTNNPSFQYCLVFDIGVIVILLAAILFFGKRKSIDVKGN